MCDKKCKNIGCENLIAENRTYCSLKCRNIYVNKYIRDYSNNRKSLSGENKYYETPKYCLECNSMLKYEQRRNKYCSHSCAASKTNWKRSGMKYIISENGMKNLIESAKKNFNIHNTHQDDYIKNP